MAKDLRHFLKVVRDSGPQFYVEARKPVNPVFEVAVLQHKLAELDRFPVLFCPTMTGSALPLVSGVIGSYDLLGLALDISQETLAREGRGAVQREYRIRKDKLIEPVEVYASNAPVQEVVLRGKEADLGALPITLHAPLNVGKYVTSGITICRDPDTGRINAGIYRQEVKGAHRIALMMLGMHHGAQIAARHASLGKRMEVVTFIGHHPCISIAASVPSGKDTDELKLGGALLGEPVSVTGGVTVDLPVPAFAEIAIEGTVDTQSMDREGPFSEGRGYYGDGLPCYVMDVSAITMRRDAIYQDLHPTHPEHRLMGLLGLESMMLDKLAPSGVEVTGLHIGPESCVSKNFGYISINKRKDEDAQVAGLGAVPPGGRIAVVVDADINVFNENHVFWALATRLNGIWAVSDTDKGGAAKLEFVNGRLEGISRSNNGKVILDATRPLHEAGPKPVVLPQELWNTLDLKEYLTI